MKRIHALALMLSLMCLAASADPYPPKDKDKGNTGRMLTGKVLDRQDNAVPDAVVYLSNLHSRAVKTYIVGTDGTYRFPELSPNTDYEVYAQYQGRKSDTKTVSQFDDRKLVNIVLRIDMK